MPEEFTPINLAALPPPDVIEPLSFEQIFSEQKAALIENLPELETVLALESEPLTKLLETFAARELLLRQRINDAAKAVMLAYATGADLDQLGATLNNLSRQMIEPGDPDATPSIPPVYETDESFRGRIQLSFEGLSTAGPRGGYQFHALSIVSVKDVAVTSPNPGEVLVTILSTEGEGTPSAQTLAAVDAVLNDDNVRPLTDQVTVQGPTIINYSVEATLYTYQGPDPNVVVQNAQSEIGRYVSEQHRLGADITLSGIYAALHRPGVQRVELVQPAANIMVDELSAAYCDISSITLTHGGVDD